MTKKGNVGNRLRLLMWKLKWYSYSLHKLQFSDFWPCLHPVPSVPHSDYYNLEERNKTHIYKNLASGKNPFREFASWLMVYMTCLPLLFLLPLPLRFWASCILTIEFIAASCLRSLFSYPCQWNLLETELLGLCLPSHSSTTDVHINHPWLRVITIN